MAEELEPMFSYTERVIPHEGRYRIQLEIPEGSRLTEGDIRRVLSAASWESDDMGRMCDGYDGGRGVVLRRERADYRAGVRIEGLTITGIGYLKMGAFGSGPMMTIMTEGMVPPSGRNFFDEVGPQGPQLATGIGLGPDGEILNERREYAPLGSYTESDARAKVENTRAAESLGLEGFMVPNVEAYGRYLDLEHGGERFAFIVFPAPVIDGRLGHQLMNSFGGEWPDFNEHMMGLAPKIGESVRELHDRGKAHRQIHFSNIYDLGKKGLYLVDWDTLRDLDGLDPDIRALDIYVPLVCQIAVQKAKYGRDRAIFRDRIHHHATFGFLQSMMRAYLGKPIDYMEEFERVARETGKTDELRVMGEMIRNHVRPE